MHKWYHLGKIKNDTPRGISRSLKKCLFQKRSKTIHSLKSSYKPDNPRQWEDFNERDVRETHKGRLQRYGAKYGVNPEHSGGETWLIA